MAETISNTDYTGDNTNVNTTEVKGELTVAVGGAIAVILTILGLLNVASIAFMCISTIALGVGLFFQSSMIREEYSFLLSQSDAGRLNEMNISGGMSIEVMAGVAGIILGLLALIGLASVVLTAVSVIVLGCAIALGSNSISRLNSFKVNASGAEKQVRDIAQASVDEASGAQVILGLGAITLGILAIAGESPIPLTLIALLAIGVSILFTGLSLSGRMSSTFDRQANYY